MLMEAPELWQARFLLAELGYQPVPTVVRGLEPEPDAVVPSLGDLGSVGMEVTDVNPRGIEVRRIEGESDRMVSEARRRYEESRQPPVDVWVFWSAFVEPAKSRRKEIAGGLVSFISDNVPPFGTRAEFSTEDDPAPALPAGIDRVVIHRLGNSETTWFSPRFVFLTEVGHSHIEEALARKNPKTANYLAEYSQRWLLLVAGAKGTASAGLLPTGIETRTFASTFDRVFLASLHQSAVVELAVRAP